MHWRNHGYYSSYDNAVAEVAELSVLQAEEEEEDGIDPDFISLGYLIEQQELDVHPSGNDQHNSWLFDHKGQLIDCEWLPSEIGRPFRGRPLKYRRFYPGEIVGVFDIDVPKITLGIVTESIPTPEEFDEYDRFHPFLDWVGEDCCYSISFSCSRYCMVKPTHIIKFRTQIPDKYVKYFDYFFR